MKPIVNRVQPGDAVISQIIAAAIEAPGKGPSPAHIQKLLTDAHTYVYAARLGEELIGYVLAYRFPSLYADGYMAYLYDIEVFSAYRRMGTGRLLIQTLLEQLKADDVTEMWLGTGTDNVAAQRLYLSTGAERSDETFNDFTYELG